MEHCVPVTGMVFPETLATCNRIEIILKTQEPCSAAQLAGCAVLPGSARHSLFELMLLPLLKPTYRSVHLKMDSSHPMARPSPGISEVAI